MGLIIALDVLQDVSFVLVEPFVSTTLGAAVSAPGSQTVAIGSTVGLYAGAVLLVNRGGATQEVVTLTAVGTGTITAVFANTHASGEPVTGATFPSGQPEKPLFTVSEMLDYLIDVENDFLLKTRCLYAVQLDIALTNYQRFYARPASAIRIERVVNGLGYAMKNTSQESQDLLDYGWEPAQSDFPNRWYEDSIGSSNFGVSPQPNAGGTMNLWFSQKDTNYNMTIASTLLIPDICAYALKFGILNRCFSKDGEQRDDFRAKYCMARFNFTVFLVNRFMKGVEAFIDSQSEQSQEFKQLLVPLGPIAKQ
jgi:hypothetical protein